MERVLIPYKYEQMWRTVAVVCIVASLMFLSALVGAALQPRQTPMEQLGQIEAELRQTVEQMRAAAD